MSEELQAQEQLTIRMVRYLKRLSMEIEVIQAQLKSGELRLSKGKGERETEKGHGGAGNHTSPLSLMYDKNSERHLIPTNKKLTGRPLKNPPDFEMIDLENLKMRIFGAEFPADSVVVAYEKNPTLENRFTLLIHVAALEKNVTPSDLMDLHGITSAFLMDSLKKMIGVNDKKVSASFLALAFRLKFPDPVKVKATQHNFYNFGSKREAVKAVKKQLEGLSEDRQYEQRGIRAVVVGEREGAGSD